MTDRSLARYAVLMRVKCVASRIGSGHFSEVGYVFYNLLNLGYAANIAPFGDNSQEKKDLAKLITRMWISFVNDLDPNNHKSTSDFLL